MDELELHNVFEDAAPEDVIQYDIVHLVVSAEVSMSICEGLPYSGPPNNGKPKKLCEECRRIAINRTGFEPRNW